MDAKYHVFRRPEVCIGKETFCCIFLISGGACSNLVARLPSPLCPGRGPALPDAGFKEGTGRKS